MTNAKYLGAIIIPAYEEAERLPAFLEQLRNQGIFEKQNWRVVVVDDGSSTNCRQRLKDFFASWPLSVGEHFDVLWLQVNRGKGGAVYAGWDFMLDRSNVLGFVDADGAVSASETLRLMKLVEEDPARAAFAARVRMLGKVVDRSWKRHLTGRVFASLVGLLIDGAVYDSQCGAKFVPAEAYRQMKPWLVEQRFAFDVELLAALRHLGIAIEEVPVNWHDVAGSKVSMLKDSFRMFSAIADIKKRRKSWAR